LRGIVDRALKKLRIFLDELVNGSPPVPLSPSVDDEHPTSERVSRAASRAVTRCAVMSRSLGSVSHS